MKRNFGKVMFMIFFSIIISMGIQTKEVFSYSEDKNYKEDIVLKNLTEEEKLEDFNYLTNIFLENYPYFNSAEKKTSFIWKENIDLFKKAIKNTNSNTEFYDVLNKILNTLQNIHTNIISPDYIKHLTNNYNNSSFKVWKNILNNQSVVKKNEQWQQLLKSKSDNSYETIPVSFYYVEGKYLAYDLGDIPCNVFGVNKGDELLEVNGIKIDNYVKGLIDKSILKYDYIRKKNYIDYLTFKESDKFTLKLKIKSINKVKELNIESGFYKENKYQLSGTNFKENVYTEKINSDIAYMAIQSFDYSRVEKDNKIIRSFLEEVKNYKNLIIDIRGNGGGSDSYWIENIVKPLILEPIKFEYKCIYKNGDYIKPFIEDRLGIKAQWLKNKNYKYIDKNLKEIFNNLEDDFYNYNDFKIEINPEKNNINFKGKIYLLVNEEVYSSAENFSVFCKSNNFATLVGTTTGGDGIGMDPALVSLPNSGLVIRFPLELGIAPDNTINEETHTFPNIYIEEKEENFIKKLDWEKNKNEDTLSKYDNTLNVLINICK